MLYNDSTNKSGICQEIDSICGTDSNSYTLGDKNRRLNSALDDLEFIALREAGNWTAEDTGRTDIVISKTDLTSGQADYAFPNELLSIDSIRILLPDGVTWSELTPLEKTPLNAGSGVPTGYRKIGNSFILSPNPNYSKTQGIEIEYRRAYVYSTVSGTTFTPTSPGIPSIFHTWLARKASLPYLMDKNKPNKTDIYTLILNGNADIKSYFGRKSSDKTKGLRVRQENNR